jgi:hypothetical protein
MSDPPVITRIVRGRAFNSLAKLAVQAVAQLFEHLVLEGSFWVFGSAAREFADY